MNDHEKKIEGLKKKLNKAKADVEKLEKELQEAYQDRFPEGYFCLAKQRAWGGAQGQHTYKVWWKPPRTSKEKGIALYAGENGQVNEQGRTYFYARRGKYEYKSLDRLLAASNRHDLPPALVDEFVKRYNARPGGQKNDEATNGQADVGGGQSLQG